MRLIALAAPLALLVAGCHAPEVTFSGQEREVTSRHIRVTTDLPPDAAATMRGWLDETLAGMCRRWGVPLPTREPLACYLFAEPADFIRFRQYDGLLRGGHAQQAGTCLGFYCAGCDAFATSPSIARARPALDDPSTWRPVEHVLAHELHHHLLDRNGGRGAPAWLSEGAAEVEGLRTWAAVEGNAPASPSQVYRALSLVALALRGLYDEPILVDPADREVAAVSWGQEYHLDLALCLALQDLDPHLLRRLCTGRPLPAAWTPARLDRAARERALLLASEAVQRLARADARLLPAARALLAALWDEPAWDGAGALPGDAVDAFWRARVAQARQRAAARAPLAARLGLRERGGERTAALAGARRAVWLLAEGIAHVAPGDRAVASLADLELWVLGDSERRALLALRTTK